MYRHRLGFYCVLLLLTACAQTPPKTTDNAAQAAEAASRRQHVVNFMAFQPPNHEVEQDISYNYHYPPQFPLKAIRAKHYGQVMLLVNVSANAEIADIRVETSSGYPELDAAAVDAVKQWVFVPAAKDGVPQSAWTRVPVNFNAPITIPPPRSPDSLQVGVATEADARALMGAPGGTMRYTSGVTELIWGNKDVGTVVLTFDTSGRLKKVYKSKPH